MKFKTKNMYKKLKYYNKNRKTIGDFAMARIGHIENWEQGT